jgi:hypothetical protein
MTDMKYTKNKTYQDGWYWYIDEFTDKHTNEIVRNENGLWYVEINEAKSAGMGVIRHIGDMEGWWYGPLIQPELDAPVDKTSIEDLIRRIEDLEMKTKFL